MEAASWLRRTPNVVAGRLLPRLQLTLKAALAAGISWQLALLFPSSVEEYAYYAPLGAVLAMYPTVSSSVHAAMQTVLGILLGASIALGVDAVISANALTVALVIGAGILVGALKWLGEQRGWVPLTALFVFTIGDPGSPSFVVGYVVLTLIGAGVGTLVNLLVFPPLHLRQSRRALSALQEVVIDQLEDLADGLEQNEHPDPEAWQQRTLGISPAVSTMRGALADLDLSRRSNPRARRYQQTSDRQARQAQAFSRLARLVEDLVDLFEETEQQDVPALPFNDKVRFDAAAAMRRLATLAQVWVDEGEVDAATDAACDSLERLENAVVADSRSGGADPFVASSVVTLLRRCLGALVNCGGDTAIARNRSRLFR